MFSMNFAVRLRGYKFSGRNISLFVPDPDEVRASYEQALSADPSTAFPYWSAIWPSAIGICEFLSTRIELIKGKDVLELAAGLGLPSVFCAEWARSVHCSDHQPAAVELISRSVVHNAITNVTCSLLDWNCLPADLSAEVLLMSDVNYSAASMPQLKLVCERFLRQGTLIILSTPVRIVANGFMSEMEQWCREKQLIVTGQGKQIHVFVMQI
jgi:predicted nicotinamide N-methyase